VSVTADSSLNEANLFTDEYDYLPEGSHEVHTSRTKQLVLVTPTLFLEIDNQGWARNKMKVDIYRADITTGGGLSDWTTVVSQRDFDDEEEFFCANLDKTACGADVDLTASGVQPYAIAWKVVANPYSDGGLFEDDVSYIRFYWGKCSFRYGRKYDSSTGYENQNTWAGDYQGHKMLILKDGFREAHWGNYKSDSPENYVTFLQDTQIAAGHTIVFEP